MTACSSFAGKDIKLNDKSDGSTFISFGDDNTRITADLLTTIDDVSYYGVDYKERGYAVFGIDKIGKRPRYTSIYDKDYTFKCYNKKDDVELPKGGKPNKRQRKSRRKSRKSKHTRRR